ncbi:MAG: cytosolic protein [Bacteroidetes bacterium MedPE-SWsnd-G2]|nr:MAG: cytosolic protein [Bacteroidetes bacterium MedPE-SWsnd-G2]
MGFLNNIFGSEKEVKDEKVLPWIPLNSVAQLDVIAKKSMTKPQLIFKHSTRCGISRMVIKQFVEDYNFSEEDFDLYYLDLLNHRDVSSEVGFKFQVNHESPQVLVIKNGVAVAFASHGGINQIDLNQFVK